MNIHSVIIKCNKYGLIVILDKDLPFEELLKDIEDKFKESAKFFKNAKMAMTIRGRVLSQSEEKQVVETIVNSCGLHILCVIDEDQKEEMLFHQAVDKAMEAKETVILGSLRGTAYAGASGDRSCFVAALVMKPIQVKIADKMARSAITKRVDIAEYKMDPKIAYVKEDHIYVKPISQEALGELSV